MAVLHEGYTRTVLSGIKKDKLEIEEIFSSFKKKKRTRENNNKEEGRFSGDFRDVTIGAGHGLEFESNIVCACVFRLVVPTRNCTENDNATVDELMNNETRFNYFVSVRERCVKWFNGLTGGMLPLLVRLKGGPCGLPPFRV